MDKVLEIGKLPVHILSDIISSFESLERRKEVIVRPKIGEDCAALSFSDDICLLSTDPITAADKDAGYFAVHINANDIAASGGEPVGVLVTVLLPAGSTEQVLREITDGVFRAASEIGIEVLGGHTEVTDAVNKPIISVTIVGKSDKFVYTGGAKAGDDVVITKYAALEGTALLAEKHKKELSEKFGADLVDKAISFKRLLSVINEAKIAKQSGAVSMHDVTEGGVLGACYEVAEAAGLGMEIYLDKVPLADESRKICEHLEVDPYCLISSGALIITAKDGDKIVSALKEQGINGAVIGKMTEIGKQYYKDGVCYELKPPKSDEIYRK